MVSDELRRQADVFVDLADLAEIIGRPSRLPRYIQEKFPDAKHDPTSDEDVGAEAEAES